MNARVPIEHAKRLLKVVKLCHDKSKAYEIDPNHSVRIGYYTVRSISADGDIVIGCHDIKWDEVEILGRQLLPDLFGV
jgi:hypothetical protein